MATSGRRKRSVVTTSVVAITFSLLTGCSHQIGTLGLASNKYVMPGEYRIEDAERVFSSGSSSHLVMFNYDIEPLATIQEAMDEAIRKVGGDFMTNASIKQTDSGIIFLVGKRTITVEGQVYRLPKEQRK
ncbi:MAG: hypothetical protein ACK5GN_14075 [Pseudomonadota bacterium]|jgi:hypothetical protein